jgi:arylsulfatase A-like enzyme
MNTKMVLAHGILAALWSAAVAFGAPDEPKASSARRPNVLILMADHARADSVEPHSQCRAPNLDALAEHGIRFGRCYTPTGMCSPARASLMTGTYASTHGVWDCTHTQRPEWVDVSPKLVQWAQRMNEAGYKTGYFGKWHLTQSSKLEDYGWQEYETAECQSARMGRGDGTQVTAHHEGYRDVVLASVAKDRGEEVHHPAYDRGIDFIRRQAASGKPFCCFVSTTEPGGAASPPKRFLDQYDPKAVRLPPTLHDDLAGKSDIIRRQRALWMDITDDEWRTINTCAMATFTFIDSEVGRIVQVLKDTGCYDNTIILFLADHGQMLGAHGLVGLGVGLPYEEVYHIPLIMRLPDGLARTKATGVDINDALVSLVDIGPTLLDFCGLAPLPGAQGRSLRPLIEGTANKADWQQAYGEFFAQRFMFTQRIVWRGDWKYVFSPGGLDELYHLSEDPYEEHNLAEDPQHHDRLIEMTKGMWQTMARIGDESLLDADYYTLRTAPIGPGQLRTSPRKAP